jgi:hypothetical protein
LCEVSYPYNSLPRVKSTVHPYFILFRENTAINSYYRNTCLSEDFPHAALLNLRSGWLVKPPKTEVYYWRKCSDVNHEGAPSRLDGTIEWLDKSYNKVCTSEAQLKAVIKQTKHIDQPPTSARQRITEWLNHSSSPEPPYVDIDDTAGPAWFSESKRGKHYAVWYKKVLVMRAQIQKSPMKRVDRRRRGKT